MGTLRKSMKNLSELSVIRPTFESGTPTSLVPEMDFLCCFTVLFNDALSTVISPQMARRLQIINWKRRSYKEELLAHFTVFSQHLPQENEENYKKVSVWMPGLRAEFQTPRLLKTMQEC
jgi:hypothetical protein